MNEETPDLKVLETWMDTQGLEAGPLNDVTRLGGGTQNILMRFRRGERSFVLRRPPAHLRANSNETMRREARVLAALRGSEVPHPDLIAACSDETIIGASFYLMEPVEGFNAAAGPLPEPHASRPDWRHRMGLSLVEAIASLGKLDYRKIGLEGFGKPEGFLERQVGRWASQLNSYEALKDWPGPEAIPGVQRVAAWLDDHCPKDSRPGIIHGDYHMGNVMFSNDSPEIAAVVDWELATIGDPLIDLGWLMATWPIGGKLSDETVATTPWDGFASQEELVAHYGRHSDRDLTHIQWYAVFACYKLGIILEGTYARACADKAPREIGDNLHARTLALFQRASNWIN